MTDKQFADFVLTHPVSGGCGTHGAENAAAAQQTTFTNQMLGQASSVFGADSGVFNAMKNAYSNLLAAGPSQQGFSAAPLSAMNASAITTGANQARFIKGMVMNQAAGTGGGFGIPGSSGAIPASLAGAEATVAGQTAGALNQIQQENYAQGNANWRAAGAGLAAAPSVYGNLSGVDEAAQGGLKANMANAQAADAASNWWVKPVTSLAMSGISAASGGLLGMGGAGGGTPFGGGSVGGMSDPSLGQIQGSPLTSGESGLSSNDNTPAPQGPGIPWTPGQ